MSSYIGTDVEVMPPPNPKTAGYIFGFQGVVIGGSETILLVEDQCGDLFEVNVDQIVYMSGHQRREAHWPEGVQVKFEPNPVEPIEQYGVM